ncbi:MAG: class I SAM-dependent methyltransferase [Desulfatibacillum sp.]|nr:class I SAM-dependent methyltransferase [Desulfatibacillum sp.]
MTLTLDHKKGMVRLIPQPGGLLRIEVIPIGALKPTKKWTTAYPPELVRALLDAKGPLFLCDEIRRDEDPCYTAALLQKSVLAYFDDQALNGKRVLDFGCGSGASSMVLKRMAPLAQIVGVERSPGLLEIARLRARHYGFRDIRFLQSPSDDQLPPDLEKFDLVLLNAVFEHLLPSERKTLVPMLWDTLKPGGLILITETPFRWFPIEMHTTGLPMINYLPDKIALTVARMFSSRVSQGESWQSLLRRGIRGATAAEVLGILCKHDSRARMAKPGRGIRSCHQVWLEAVSERKLSLPMSFAINSARKLTAATGLGMSPYLCLAIKKEHGTPYA